MFLVLSVSLTDCGLVNSYAGFLWKQSLCKEVLTDLHLSQWFDNFFFV